ncbi:MAG: inositol monophosphatase [Ignavibacteriaceae bacterium]
MNEIKIATDAVLLAAQKISELFCGDINIESENGRDIKIEADKISENIITKHLTLYSNYKVLSEENSLKLNYLIEDYIWIVDPLDGSLNFSRRIPLFCISIGLWKRGKPLLGVVYDISRNELYFGKNKIGAFCEKKRIFTSKISDKSRAILATGFPVYSDFDTSSLKRFISKIQKFKKIRLLGSAAYSIILVASGSIEAYCEDNIAIWDVAGALAILNASGGEYVLEEGKSINLVNIYATNGSII